METVEGSIKEKDWLIDDFMGRNRTNWGSGHKYISYSNDWNMLMPVVEKIESLFEDNITVQIYDGRCIIEMGTQYAMATDTHLPENFYNNKGPKIHSTWLSIVQFIQWYNSQTPTNDK
jgi:hypothetical protein